jgi:SAM-dependent methyltransferase
MTDHDDLGSFYDETYAHEGEEAEHWRQWRLLNAEIKVDKIVALWRGAPPQTICEVGCGDGVILAQLHDRGFGEAFDGFEVSVEAVEIAKRNPAFRRIEPYDGQRLPVPDDSYDLGILSHVLEHVPDPRALLAETARACQRVIVEVPLEDNVSARRPRKVAEFERIVHMQRFSRGAMRELAADVGLRVDGEISDALTKEHQQFLNPGPKGAAKWAVREGAMRVAPPLARRLFTVHYTALLTR